MYFIFVSGKETNVFLAHWAKPTSGWSLWRDRPGSRFLHFLLRLFLSFSFLPHLFLPSPLPVRLAVPSSPTPPLPSPSLFFSLNTAPGICVIHVIWGAQAGGTHRQEAWHLRASVLPVYTPQDSNWSHICGDGGEEKKICRPVQSSQKVSEVHRWIPIL